MTGCGCGPVCIYTGQELPPGVYRVDIYLNDTYISTRDVQFQMSQDGKQLAPLPESGAYECDGGKPLCRAGYGETAG